MSLKSQILRDLVVERLVVAADEIFALFERTFAEYEEDLRIKLHQETRGELQTQQRLPSELGVEAMLVPSEVKYEDRETPLELPFNFKSEENINKSCFYQEEPTEEHSQDTTGQLYGAEEPGCSMVSDMNELEPYSCSDTDNSEDWQPASKRKTKSNGQTLNRFHEELHKDILNSNYQNPENMQYGWSESELSIGETRKRTIPNIY
ncbi:hypothetical protein NQD34_000752 [Periophthalmus magnuspinnatus]|nr:hypothetical protein NQD34_000752 [Periophthalmus magnuspinnatus]